MVRSETWLLRGLLGLMCVLPLWMNVMSNKCNALHTIKDQLNSSLRRRYLKQNFPINYTIPVHYEEVFRLHNISRLMSEEHPVEVTDLQNLWILVAKAGIKKILRVLPERHPTRLRYLTGLEKLFRDYEQSYKNGPQNGEPQFEIPENIGASNGQEWRSVTPKSLLDNCYRTMHCLFKECFSRDEDEYDYCNVLHWRKRKGTTPQPS